MMPPHLRVAMRVSLCAVLVLHGASGSLLRGRPASWFGASGCPRRTRPPHARTARSRRPALRAEPSEPGRMQGAAWQRKSGARDRARLA